MYRPEEDCENVIALTVIASSLPINVRSVADTHSYLWAHA